MSYHIRWMIRRDMAEVLDIESRSFDHPWTEEDFLTALRQRSCIGMVCECRVDPLDAGRVVGFMLYELFRTGVTIQNFAVDHDYRRIGVGTAMVQKIVGKLSQHRRRRIMLTTRDSNLPAHLFFRACGFAASKVIRNFYQDTGEDAYEFVYQLPVAQEVSP